jgi:hypothetical protein
MPRVAWKSFTEGRALVRGLGLGGHRGWQAWSKSGQRPSDIPADPFRTYRDDGWISWNDWLGFEGRAPPGSMLPFAVGRAYVRKLKLEKVKEWREWRKSKERPSNIPSDPDRVYRDDGWVSWPDWLGNGKERVAWKSFTEGRVLVRGLELKTQKGWREWSKSKRRPSDIPSNPEKAYRDVGWISWPDWLGNGGTAKNSALSFAVGKAYVRKLKLRSVKEWKEWSKSGQRPSNIPGNPFQVYRDDGWISYPDWLGSEGGRAPPGSMLPFAAARAYVRKLKLRNNKEWLAWSKSGQRPSNIPSSPAKTYRDDGWVSMPDLLGYGSAGGAAASRSSSSSSSATTAPKKKTKQKRKRRPATTHPSDLPPPPPPSTSSSTTTIKTEPPSSKSSGGSVRSTEPPLRKIKKEEDA